MVDILNILISGWLLMAFDIYLDGANIINHSVLIEYLCQFLNKLCI